MASQPKLTANWSALEKFWNRTSFHDEEISEVLARNGRAIIWLSHYSLIVTSVLNLQRCEVPTVWLYHTLAELSGNVTLDVETESGHIRVTGRDVRLIRSNDMAILIPAIDS